MSPILSVTETNRAKPRSLGKPLHGSDSTAARSAAIVRYFVSKGLAAERFSAIGRGEYHPLFPNDTPEHKALNRRAEIIVIYTIEKQNYAIGPNSVLAPGGTTKP